MLLCQSSDKIYEDIMSHHLLHGKPEASRPANQCLSCCAAIVMEACLLMFNYCSLSYVCTESNNDINFKKHDISIEFSMDLEPLVKRLMNTIC